MSVSMQAVLPGSGSSSAPAGGLSGIQKAAIYILSLDEETASKVLKALSDAEAQTITREIAALGVVDQSKIRAVLEEFTELRELSEYVQKGGTEQAVKLITKANPTTTATRLNRLLRTARQDSPFAFLKHCEIDRLHAFLREEHPQTIAVVLSHLDSSKGTEILARFPPERRFDIANRIAHLKPTNRDAVPENLDAGSPRLVEEIIRGRGGDEELVA